MFTGVSSVPQGPSDKNVEQTVIISERRAPYFRVEFVGCKESDTTEHTHINNKYLFSSYYLPDIFLHDFSILFHLIFKLYDVSTLLYLFTDKEK